VSDFKYTPNGRYAVTLLPPSSGAYESDLELRAKVCAFAQKSANERCHKFAIFLDGAYIPTFTAYPQTTFTEDDWKRFLDYHLSKPSNIMTSSQVWGAALGALGVGIAGAFLGHQLEKKAGKGLEATELGGVLGALVGGVVGAAVVTPSSSSSSTSGTTASNTAPAATTPTASTDTSSTDTSAASGS
jgi:uncharacterized membrane protein YeaQ/YmgE (transglycosylase-associated protein family)